MATTGKTSKPSTSSAKKSVNEQTGKKKLISNYMEWVLLNETTPRSIYKFCKEHNFEESEFYKYFGSFEGLRMEIWKSFYDQTLVLAHKEESYTTYSNREKMLTFYYTFFQLLTLNRSYVLLTLKEHKNITENLAQLKGLRQNIKRFAADLMREYNEEKKLKILRQPVAIFSEGAWLQTLFLMKYWMDDNSPGFENTDIAIEKSVRAIFDVFDTQPFESVLDFGKFLWKEKRV